MLSSQECAPLLVIFLTTTSAMEGKHKRRKASNTKNYPKKVMHEISPESGCLHDARYNVVADDGEIVCRLCGVVKGVEYRAAKAVLSSAAAQADTQTAATVSTAARSRASLFLEMETGGRPDSSIAGSRYVRCDNTSTDLAVVSDISQKMGIPNHMGRDVWRWYQKLRKAGVNMTKAKLLVLIFYNVCRCYGYPYNEQNLLEIIRIRLGVRHAHPYLKVVMEASSYMSPDGEMILRQTGFLDMKKGEAFPLHNEISNLSSEYPPEIAEKIKTAAREIFPLLVGGSDKSRAKTAIKMAMRRCGL